MEIKVITPQAEKNVANFLDVETLEGLQGVSRLFLEGLHWEKQVWQRFMGISAVQMPQDFYHIQTLVLDAKPDVIIETGTAFGGTSLFLASLLHLLGNKGPVYSIDIHERDGTKESREKARHLALDNWGIPIVYFLGSSLDPKIYGKIQEKIKENEKVLVVLDSNHDVSHVLRELDNYIPFLKSGDLCLVFDTHCRFISDKFKTARFWSFAADPFTAVQTFLTNRGDLELVPLETYNFSALESGVIRKK